MFGRETLASLLVPRAVLMDEAEGSENRVELAVGERWSTEDTEEVVDRTERRG